MALYDFHRVNRAWYKIWDNMKNTLVTGATGFIGSHLCRALVAKGDNVFGLTRSGKTGKLGSILDSTGFHLLEGDITDSQLVNRLISENLIDRIYHLAAVVPDGTDNYPAYFDTNTRGTFNLLQAADSCRVKSFIYASTLSVYSGFPEQLPVKESHPTSPMNPYGLTKLAGEITCNMFSTRMNITILRFGAVYGNNQYEKDVMPIFLRQALHNDTIHVHGDGKQSSDFVYIDDVVEALLLAGEKNKAGVYNLSSGQETKIIELAEKITSAAGSKSEIKVTGKETDRPFRFYMDITRARREFGWSPRSLDEGLSEYIRILKAEV